MHFSEKNSEHILMNAFSVELFGIVGVDKTHFAYPAATRTLWAEGHNLAKLCLVVSIATVPDADNAVAHDAFTLQLHQRVTALKLN